MTSSPENSPFVSFPLRNAPSSAVKPGPRPNLDFLGQSSAGDLYFNRDYASLGLICCSLVEDAEAVVKRLVAAHTGKSDAQVLIFYSDTSVTRQKPCSLLNLAARKPKILISPRNLQSASQLYASAGAATAPLIFQESSITMQHLLEFFTPPSDMQGRSTVLNTIQLIISQLSEPFDLQYFIELIEKENWTDDGANFMALRQTILTSLLSSSQSSSSLSPNDDIVVDLGDPILSKTGLDNILMDMLLHQFLLHPTKRRQMLVFYNSHAYLSAGSPLSQSLESLATSGSKRPISIILATASSSSIPLGYCNSLDYVVYGHSRSSVWKSTLREHFSFEPQTKILGQLAIWSPDSQHCAHGRTEPPAQRAESWERGQAIVDVSELRRTTAQTSEGSRSFFADTSNGNVAALVSNMPPARSTHPVSLPLDGDEEGMVPLSSLYLGDMRRKASPTPGVQYGAGGSNAPSVESAAMAMRTPVSTADSLPSATATSSTTFIARDVSAYQPLISAIIRVSNNQLDALVSFEAVRTILGNNAAIKKLGWPTYTSFVEDARRQKLLHIIEISGGIKFMRLSPSVLHTQSSPAVRVEPLVAGSPKPTASPKPAASTKVDPKGIPIIAGKPPSSTTKTTALSPILQNCPAKHRPLVEAVLRLGMNNLQAKVSFDAVGALVGKTKAEVQALGYGWLSYPHWAQKAHEDGWILQGSFGGNRWMMLGPKLLPKPIAVTSVQVSPKIVINKPPADGGDSGKVKDSTVEPIAGPSSGPKFTPKPTTPDPPTPETTLSHPNGPNQSNFEVRTVTDHSENAMSSPAAAVTRVSTPSQNTPNVTLNLAPLKIQSRSSPTSSVSQVIVTKSGSTRDEDRDNGLMGKEVASSVLPSPGQSRRVSVDSYPSRHRLVVRTMLALGDGSSHVPVRSERLLSALRSTTYMMHAEPTSPVLATVQAGILKKFVNARGETWFSLENPVQTAPSQDVAMSWIRSLVPSWF